MTTTGVMMFQMPSMRLRKLLRIQMPLLMSLVMLYPKPPKPPDKPLKMPAPPLPKHSPSNPMPP